MKKILFATLVVLSISSVSCTSDAIDSNTDSNNMSNNHSTMLLNQKNGDSIGSQGGTTPPPPPKP